MKRKNSYIQSDNIIAKNPLYMNRVITSINIMAIIMIIAGCGSMHTIVEYQNTNSDKISITIPKNYVFEGIQGGREIEHRYWYSDSSVIYITTFENTLNYEDIREQGTYFERFESLRFMDSLTLEGTGSNGLYWKDKLLENGITVGYSRVPKSRLKDFNKVISSIK